MNTVKTNKADQSRRVAMVGDKVKSEYGNVVYTVLERYEVRDEAFVLLANFDKGCARGRLFDLVIVEYSPLHKFAIMGEAFRFVEMGHDETGWDCSVFVTDEIEFMGTGNTPDEAINACWDKWKSVDNSTLHDTL